MSERYTRVFLLGENQYQTGSPLLIAAGALLKDNQSGNVLAQIKYINIASLPIKAFQVEIQPLDVVGAPIGNAIEHSYLDLDLKRDADFGSKSPVKLPDSATRGFSVTVLNAVFANGSVWNADGKRGEQLSKQVSLKEWIPNEELLKQYRMSFGEHSSFQPDTQFDLWRCSCGGINRHEEDRCHICGNSKKSLLSLDLAALTAEKDRRLENERLAAEQAAAEKSAAEEAQKKRTKKIASIAIPAAILVIALALLTVKVFIPQSKYNKAVSLAEAGSYDEAMAAFSDMDGYKDSAEKWKETQFKKALALCDAGEYQEAYEISLSDDTYASQYPEEATHIAYCYACSLLENDVFDEASRLFESFDINYEETADKLEQCYTGNANALMEQGEYDDAIAWYKKSSGFSRSSDFYQECLYRKGLKLIANEDYIGAVTAFTSLTEYKDSKDQLLLAEYQYVLSHYTPTDNTTSAYLEALIKANYKDSAELYEKLYVWNVEVLAWNNSENDTTTNKNYVPKGQWFYVHFMLTGGETGASTKITVEWRWPDNTTEKSISEYIWSRGDSGYWRFIWEGKSGPFTINFYDENNNLIGSGSVNIR